MTVSSAPSTLNTENANVAGTLTQLEVQSLPQVGRDPYQLVRLAPGSSAWARAAARAIR